MARQQPQVFVKNLLDERFGANLQEIKNGIAILFEPGQVVELRVAVQSVQSTGASGIAFG